MEYEGNGENKMANYRKGKQKTTGSVLQYTHRKGNWIDHAMRGRE